MAWSHRGEVLKELLRWIEALASYDRAIALNSAIAETHSNRESVFKELNRLDTASNSFDTALKQNPMLADANSNRGIVLAALGRSEAALASYDRAYPRASTRTGALQSIDDAARAGAFLERMGRARGALGDPRQ